MGDSLPSTLILLALAVQLGLTFPECALCISCNTRKQKAHLIVKVLILKPLAHLQRLVRDSQPFD